MGENRLRFNYISQPEAIINGWPVWEKGMESMLENAYAQSLDKIKTEILSARLSFFECTDGGEYIGFFTARIDDGMSPLIGRYFTIMHAYCKPHGPKNLLPEYMKLVAPYAKALGCKGMRMWTEREKGFERVLGPYGWKPTYTEFKVDFEEDK